MGSFQIVIKIADGDSTESKLFVLISIGKVNNEDRQKYLEGYHSGKVHNEISTGGSSWCTIAEVDKETPLFFMHVVNSYHVKPKGKYLFIYISLYCHRSCGSLHIINTFHNWCEGSNSEYIHL